MENKDIPPLGMCGKKMPEINAGQPLLTHSPYTGEHRIKGMLSVHRSPVLQVRLIKGSETTDWIDALIDTGSFYSLAKQKVFDMLGLNVISTFEADSPEMGKTRENVYVSGFQISGLPIGFSTLFMEMRDSFQYDIIIGSHFLEICDLHIYGKEKRFELIFK